MENSSESQDLPTAFEHLRLSSVNELDSFCRTKAPHLAAPEPEWRSSFTPDFPFFIFLYLRRKEYLDI